MPTQDKAKRRSDHTSSLVGRMTKNNLVLDYLIYEAHESTAEKFAKEVGITLDCSIRGYQSIGIRHQLKLHILKGDISNAIDLLSLRYPELLEENDYLYFKLLLMNLIEMIRHHDGNDEQFVLRVIQFAQEKLSNKAVKNPEYMKELELTMTLLLYSQNKELLPQRLTKLFDLKQRRHIASVVNGAVLSIDCDDYNESQLKQLIKLQRWAVNSRK